MENLIQDTKLITLSELKMTPEDIHFPPYQGHTVKVSVINGANAHMPVEMIIDPAPSNRDQLHNSTYAFLIESTHRNQRVLYDLAFMKDVRTRMPPVLQAIFGTFGDRISINDLNPIPDTLQTQGIDLSSINAIIWSHTHIDHVGDPSLFPASTDLIVGPGVKENYIPGYPANPNGVVLDSSFHNRNVRELSFPDTDTDTVIGGFRAVDFFSDGSFYLLHAPGHTAHHLCALCRTTEDTWVFLGGDICHHVAQLRPSSSRPLPESVPATLLGMVPPPVHCSCAHLANGDGKTIYGIAGGIHEDIEEAKKTIEKLKAFDGRDDVMVIIAHDSTLLDVLSFFPYDINDWKEKGLADRGRWVFLKDITSTMS